MDTLSLMRTRVGAKSAYLDPVDVVVAEPLIAFLCHVIKIKRKPLSAEATRLLYGSSPKQ
jgi:hypothetical protein